MQFVRSLALVAGFVSSLAGQSPTGPRTLGIEDYPRWRTIAGAQLAPDGAWLAFGYRQANTLTADAKPVLHLRRVDTDDEITIPDAGTATFSRDSRWVIYQVDPPARRPGGRGGAADTSATPAGAGRGSAPAAPLPRRLELRELATGTVRYWRDIQSASFTENSRHLILRRRAATPPTGAAAATAGRGVDVIVLDLQTGRSLLLGHVGELAVDRRSAQAAYTIDAASQDGNGLFLLDLATSRITPLDNDSLRYSRLSWNPQGTGIAVFKSREVPRKRERETQLLVFRNVAEVGAPITVDPKVTTGFPTGFVLNERSGVTWSEDGRRVALTILPQSDAPDTTRRRSTDSLANVDVWHTQDDRIQSVQMAQATGDLNRSFRQLFDLDNRRWIALADSAMRDIDIPLTGNWGVGQDARPYISDYQRPRADYYRVNLTTGERTRFLTGQLTGPHIAGISPDGRYFLYWARNAWQATELATGISRPLKAGKAAFLNETFDYPGPRPPYAIAGYAADGSGVIALQRFDLWFLPFDSTGTPRSLTGGVGAAQQIVFRPVRLAPLDTTERVTARATREYDLTQPLTVSAYGEWTKKAGFYRLANGSLTPLLFEDAAFSMPVRALDRERYLFTRQTFREFPDLRIADGDLASSRQMTEANPQQSEYRWGSRLLFDYTTRRGVRLQGVLALPDGYQPGQKLPMLVTFYEKNSQNMHRYPTPSYLTGMGGDPIEAVSRGYAVMLPDVHFHTGSSHSDMLDAVEAATRKVIALGYADPARIGVHGHSYGGEGAAFIGTRSKLFAAVGMGAGVTDLTSDFSQSWGWTYQISGGSGANGNNYYMIGQGRWGFSPWDRPEVYRYESALTHAPNATAPFLIMHGTADPTVSFTEGMNFYNALRYNGKRAVMLAYPGEGHGLSGLANRIDLTRRYFEFFDHYLRGEPAPAWLTDGVPFLQKDKPTGGTP